MVSLFVTSFDRRPTALYGSLVTVEERVCVFSAHACDANALSLPTMRVKDDASSPGRGRQGAGRRDGVTPPIDTVKTRHYLYCV